MSASPALTSPASSVAPRSALRQVLAAAVAAIPCVLAVQGGWMLGAALLLGCGWAAWLARPAAQPGTARGAVPESGGVSLMAQQIVPVWERQLQSARGVAEEGLGNVMQHLGGLSESLAAVEQQVLQIDVSTGAGAADEVLGDSSEALQALQAPAQRAFNERDQSLALLQELREPMSALTQLVLQLQTVAAHTRLVSMNASIEASRNSGDGGTRAVAEEVRAVAARIGDSATLIAQRVTEMDQSLLRSLREGELLHTSGEELRLELQLRAREALERMLGSLGAHLGGSHALHASCEALRAQSEQMLMSFQFGDRLNQMLGILGHDMERFIAWIAENRPASHVEAAQWLSDLEASYTTDEQRARHHDNVHVQRSNNVEFF